MLISGSGLSESSGSDSLNLFENLYVSIFKINLPGASGNQVWEPQV